MLRIVLLPFSVLQIAAVFAWTGICVGLAMIARLTTGDARIALGLARWLWSPGVLAICGQRIVSVEGLDAVDWSRPYFVASNHQSFLDIPVLFRALPVNLRFVAKSELKSLPFVSHYVDAMDMVWVDRKDAAGAKDSIRAVGQAVAAGRTVLLFPEGTRSTNRKVNRFKSGILSAALGSGAEVLPVAIVGTERSMPPGLSIWPGTIRVRVGQPIDPSRFGPEDRRPLADATQAAVAALYEELQRDQGR